MNPIKPLTISSILLIFFIVQSDLTAAATWSNSDKQVYQQNCVKGAHTRINEYMKLNKNNKKMKKKLLSLKAASEAMCTCVMNEIMKKWSLSDVKNAGKEYFDYIRKVSGPNQACDARKFVKK